MRKMESGGTVKSEKDASTGAVTQNRPLLSWGSTDVKSEKIPVTAPTAMTSGVLTYGVASAKEEKVLGSECAGVEKVGMGVLEHLPRIRRHFMGEDELDAHCRDSLLSFCPKVQEIPTTTSFKGDRNEIAAPGNLLGEHVEGESGEDEDDDDDDITISGSKFGVINICCPLSGKLVTELDNPVQSIDCRHIYEQEAAFMYINQHTGPCRCAVTGCPKFLGISGFSCEMSLRREIEEIQKSLAVNLNLFMECMHLDDD